MRVLSGLILTLTLAAAVMPVASAQHKETAMLTTEDHKEIGAVLERFDDAWKRRDMQAFAALMTEDCEWVNIVGMRWTGREQVVRAHHNLLEGRYKGVNVHTTWHDESAVAPGVAVVRWDSWVDAFTGPDGKPVDVIKTRGTMVMVKQDGHWLIRAGQNSVIDPIAAQHDPGR